MTRETRLKVVIRCLAAAVAIGVASSTSSTLFAQARGEVSVSATVIAPSPLTELTSSATTSASIDVTMINAPSRQLMGGIAQVRMTRETAAKGEPVQPVVVTLEYAAN